MLDLPSTLIRHGAKTELCENTLETGGLCTRRLCVLVWTENMLKTYIHTYIHTYFICHVGQNKKAAKKLMWTYKFKYIYSNSNNNVNKLKNYLQ